MSCYSDPGSAVNVCFNYPGESVIEQIGHWATAIAMSAMAVLFLVLTLTLVLRHFKRDDFTDDEPE